MEVVPELKVGNVIGMISYQQGLDTRSRDLGRAASDYKKDELTMILTLVP